MIGLRVRQPSEDDEERRAEQHDRDQNLCIDRSGLFGFLRTQRAQIFGLPGKAALHAFFRSPDAASAANYPGHGCQLWGFAKKDALYLYRISGRL